MARADFINRVKVILNGYGLGEKPSVVRTHATTPSLSVSGTVATFTLASGEGTKVNAGDVIQFVSPASKAAAYKLYVLSIATDTLTCWDAYQGAPSISGASIANATVEILGDAPADHEIHDAVDMIFARFLWPEVYKTTTETISTPNVTTNRAELNASDLAIDRAWQFIGNELVTVPSAILLGVPTALSSTGVLGLFDYPHTSACYLKVRRKMVVGDEATYVELIPLVATGAAALLLGAQVAETQYAVTHQDSQTRGINQRDVSAQLWRDYQIMLQRWADELGRVDSQYFNLEL